MAKGRRQQLRREVWQYCRQSRRGSYATRKETQRLLLAIVDDLLTLKCLPPSWRALKQEHVAALVAKWRSTCSDTSIMAKLSRLRHFNQLFQLGMVIPSNKALQVQARPVKKSQPPVDLPRLLQSTQHSITRFIIQLQAAFGLTCTESMQINLHLSVCKDTLIVDRRVAYNGKERHVPIITPSQQGLLGEIQEAYPKGFLARVPKRKIAMLYQTELALIGANLDVPIRGEYAKNRYQALCAQVSKRAAIKQLQLEMGYSARRYLMKEFAK